MNSSNKREKDISRVAKIIDEKRPDQQDKRKKKQNSAIHKGDLNE